MPTISTDRLHIKPTHKNCWSIYDQFDRQLIGKLFFRDQWFNILLKPQSLRLGVATEASYGLMKAINSDTYKAKTEVPHAKEFLHKMGFTQQDGHFAVTAENLTCPDLYHDWLHKLHIQEATIIPPKQATAAQLVDTDKDCFNRPCKLHPQAHQAWQRMKQAAQAAGIDLQLVSAFRSMGYQASLIAKKLDAGQKLEDILATNAAPGHSEHHTGCVIDLTTPGAEPLEESFENTEAFAWLSAHANEHGFHMTYPKDNPWGIIYEPWHWRYQPPN
ncbi:M15 family metallopeptidase [Marinicella meishanensis]|uniref:M15 family metallopeptidase n=1 Tax=Marinicella meishanensis TaxID=2873263 RepID=UPI001CBEF74A|nr:M15 family metallopeptidase [Marinicella sp. NBU2979]